MKLTEVKSLFLDAWLGEVTLREKIEVGFSNDVYSVDDKFILKIGTSEWEESENIRRDIYFCKLFSGKIPTPKVLHDWICNNGRPYMIYERIEWENLYNKWHLLSDSQKRKIVSQICDILKVINETSYGEYIKEFCVIEKSSWSEQICSNIDESLGKILWKGILSQSKIYEVQNYVQQNKAALQEERIRLVYWDIHFDNLLIYDGEIVWILDFERMYIASIDYVLDLVNRMVEQPKKYASEEAEAYIIKEDYEKLLKYYQEFYPQLFDFPQLKMRLNLYSIERTLNDIYYFPDAVEPKEFLNNYLTV